MCLPSCDMALRTRSATSGPGRAPASDSRVRHGRGSDFRSDFVTDTDTGRGPGRGPGTRGRPRGGYAPAASATALRRRADALFDRVPRGGGAGPGPGRGGAMGRAGPALLDRPDDDDAERSAASAPDARVAAGGFSAAPEAGEGPRAPHRVRVALRERLPLWVQLRCGLEPRTLAALAVVLVVAAVFAAQHFWTGRPQSVRAPELVRQGAASLEAARPSPSSGPGPGPGPGPVGAGPAAGGRIVVDVSGKVQRPGIHRLHAGSRVADALRAAGGARAGTDLTGLNRARLLMDGEQVVVGGPTPPGPVATGPGTGGAQAAGPVSLNSATAEQLETLPGVGPVLAQHIVDYRTQHGGFRSIDELTEVNGIGDRRFADLRPLVQP